MRLRATGWRACCVGVMLATGSLRAAELDAMLGRYEAMLVQTPDSATAFDRLVQEATVRGRLDELTERWSKEPGAVHLVLRARLALRLGKADEARGLFNQALAAEPDNRAFWRLKAESERVAGRADEVILANTKVLELGAQGEERLEAYRNIALMQQRLLQTDDAAATLNKMASEFPDDPFVLGEAGDALAEAGKLAEAREMFQRVRDLGNVDPFRRLEAMLRIAEIEVRLSGRDAGVAVYEEILADSAQTSWIHREARNRIDAVFRGEADLPGLVDYYEKRLEREPRDVDALQRMAEALADLGANEEAANAYRRAIELAPGNVDLRIGLTGRLLEIGEFDEAIDLLEKMAREEPGEMARIEAIGDARWRKFQSTNDPSDRAAAIATWASLAQGDSPAPGSVRRVAEILLERGLVDESLPWLERAVDLEPDALEIRAQLAQALVDLGREAEIESVLRGAVEGSRATAENHLALAGVYRRFGRTGLALKTAAAGLEISPESFDLRLLQSRLLIAESRWTEVAGLHDALMAAAPGPRYETEVEKQTVEALAAAEVLESRATEALARWDSGAAQDEASARMLIRMLLRRNDQPGAQRVLATATERFPDSLAIAELDAAFQQLQGSPADRRRSLERLVQLDAANRAQWLADIARSHMDEGNWEEALATAQRRISLSPASEDGYLFAAEVAFAAGRSEEGIRRLEEALRVSQRPPEIRARLARAYADAGRHADALRAQEEAFEQESDPERKLRLVGELADLYLQAGRIDELIQRFRSRRQEGGRGTQYTWLAVIHLRMENYAAAREELARGLASSPRDASLLRQLLELSIREQNSEEQLKYARALAEVQPTTDNQLLLVEALLDAGDVEAARAQLRDLGGRRDAEGKPVDLSGFLRFPELRGDVVQILREQLAGDPSDWESAFALAVTILSDGDFAAADEILKGIQATPLPDIRVESSATEASSPAFAMAVPPRPVSAAEVRLSRAEALSLAVLGNVQRTRNAFTQGQRGSRMLPRSATTGGIHGGARIQDAEEVRLAVLVLRAFIAVESGTEEEFLRGWEADANRRALSPEDRLVELNALQAAERLREEAVALARSPSATPEQLLLALRVLQGRALQAANIDSTVNAEILALAERLRDLAPALDVASTGRVIQILRVNSRGSEANELVDRLVARADELTADDLASLVTICLQSGKLESAISIYGDLMGRMPGLERSNSMLRRIAFSAGWQLATAMTRDPKHRAAGAELCAALLREVQPAMTLSASGIRVSRRGGSPVYALGPENIGNVVPLETARIDMQRKSLLQSVYQQLSTAGAVDDLIAALERQEAAMADGEQITPRLARIYLQWWSGRKEEAIAATKILRKEHPGENLDAFLATMQAANGDVAGAWETIANAQPANREDAMRNAFLAVSLAAMASDMEALKREAERFEKLLPQSNERAAVAGILATRGLEEEARRMQRVRTARRSGEPFVDRLNELSETGQRDVAVAIARGVLLSGVPSPLRASNDNVRQVALSTVSRHEAMEEVISEVRGLLAAQPDSVRLNALMAELTMFRNSQNGLPFLEKLVALQPGNRELRERYARLLNEARRAGEAADIYTALLEEDFLASMQRNFSEMFQTFQQAKRTGEFVDLVERNVKGSRRDMQTIASSVRWIGEQLESLEDIDGAERMYHIAQDLRPTDFTLLPRYVGILQKKGRHEEANRRLLEAMFPQPKSRAKLLASQQVVQRGAIWSSWVPGRSGDPYNIGMQLFDLLDGDDAKAEALARASDFRKLEPAHGVSEFADRMLRVRMRDATILKELRELLSSGSGLRWSDPNAVRSLAGELAEWPEGRDIALELALKERAKRPAAAAAPFEVISAGLLVIKLARECGKPEVARKEARSTFRELAAIPEAALQHMNDAELGEFLQEAVSLGLADDARKLIGRIRKVVNRNDYLTSRLRTIEATIQLAMGEVDSPFAMVWPAEDADGARGVAWRMGAAETSDAGRSSYIVPIQDVPALDGKYDLDLIAEFSPNERRRITTVRRANFAGFWKGALPAGATGVYAMLRPAGGGDQSFIGWSVPAAADGGGNLVRNPAYAPGDDGGLPGWTFESTFQWIEKGAPDGRGAALELDVRGDRALLKAEPIELRPDTTYEVTIWCAPIGPGRNFQAGVKLLDENRKEIGAEHCSSRVNGEGWSLLSRRFTTGSRSQPNVSRIDATVRWVQPYVQCGTPTRVGTIRVSEIPVGPAEE